MYDIVCKYSDRVQDGRTLQDIFNHGEGEMVELQSELLYDRDGLKPGPDGIVGEAIDIIACMMDIIRKKAPELTEEDLGLLMHKKCQKWVMKVEANLYRDQ